MTVVRVACLIVPICLLIAGDFHCTVCHGESKAHLDMEEIGTLPDRAWRRWIEEEDGFEWRVRHASLEIAKFCASCHGQKPPEKKPPEKKPPGEKPPKIDWKEYLGTEHGRAVLKDNHDAPTCTDCHHAHGAGAEPMTDKTIVRRCALCHTDKRMMKRAGLDPGVIDDFKAGTHANMDEASVEEKASCVKCHPPH